MIEHVEPGRVQWVDTDAGGRIHFTAAFRWAEAAETALMRRLGGLEEWGSFPRRRVEADFVRVLVFGDAHETRIRVARVGRTSITYAWEIVRGDELCVTGGHTAVHVGADGRPEELPARLRQRLAEA